MTVTYSEILKLLPMHMPCFKLATCFTENDNSPETLFFQLKMQHRSFGDRVLPCTLGELTMLPRSPAGIKRLGLGKGKGKEMKERKKGGW